VAKKQKQKPRFSRLKIKLLLALLALGAAGCLVYGVWAEFYDLKELENLPERSVVYDMDGKYYSRLQGENRVPVPLAKISPWFVKALLAREDTRFYKHHGIDPFGILRAMALNAIHLSVRQGASTLTQQLALNTYLGGKHVHSLHRKLLEAAIALRIERNYKKDRILESYINRIYFGSGYYGVETASQAYFGKPAAQLGLGESAMLVGLIRSPNRFSPFKNPEGACAQRDTVIHRMADLKMITREQADTAIAAKVAVSQKRIPALQDNYATAAVLADLDILLSDDQVEGGGLRIYTTIDPVLQKTAEAALDEQLSKVEERPGYPHPKKADFSAIEGADTPYLQGSLIAIDNRSGGIRAVAGGRDYKESTYNRAFLTKRQAGSTFKPFVYAAAFARGLSPDAEIDDGPVHIGGWSPSNSDGTFKGPMPVREGLIQSRNTMSVRVGSYAGIDEVQRIASTAGLGTIPRFPSVYLGTFETTLKDLTSAYTIFPNGGTRRQPYLIERIDDSDGTVLYRAAHINTHALDSNICALMTSIMEQVLDHGTAAVARSLGFNKPAAGKTGTTNEFKDAWFIGFTQSLTCGVWVGLDKPQTIVSKGYGSALALPVWAEFMNAASARKYPAPPFESRWQAPQETRSGPAPDNIFRSVRKFFGGH
jgi:penicillin-binding protein 1A